MAVAMYIGLVSLVLGVLTRLHVIWPIPPWKLAAPAFLDFSMACFLFAILAGLTHIVRTKG
ncbi:MAG: hypothetical protein AMJ92_01600 [candidate division Zixibacteria bacterium SM23_81]|nr:MAG: hypothetical protein AMJ92_01600 [candidate division Zixibacteria bacterium SM23_81]